MGSQILRNLTSGVIYRTDRTLRLKDFGRGCDILFVAQRGKLFKVELGLFLNSKSLAIWITSLRSIQQKLVPTADRRRLLRPRTDVWWLRPLRW